MILRLALLAAVAVVAACGSVCDPKGDRLASASFRNLETLAADNQALYWLELEEVAGEEQPGAVVVRTLPKSGGAARTIVRTGATEFYVRSEILVDATNLYWLDPCVPSGPTCRRLLRAPKAGGDPTVLVAGDLYAIALDGESIFFTISQENGLQPTTPTGTIGSIPTAGGSTMEIATGYVRLRDVRVDADALYFAATSADGSVARIMKRSRLDGAETELATFDTPGFAFVGDLAVDATHVYFQGSEGAGARIWRVAKAGGAREEVVADAPYNIGGFYVDGDDLYWSDAGLWESEGDDGPSHYTCGAIYRTAVSGGARALVAAEQREPTRIVVDAARVYWATFGNFGVDAEVRAIPRP
jgi:hypothetical protein